MSNTRSCRCCLPLGAAGSSRTAASIPTSSANGFSSTESARAFPPLPTRKHALPYHRGFYRHRRKVENAFCRLKRFRRLATRYEKLALSFDSLLCFAIALDWLTYEV